MSDLQRELKIMAIEGEYELRIRTFLTKHGVEHWLDAKTPEARAELDQIMRWYTEEHRAAWGRRRHDGELLPDEIARRRAEIRASKAEAPDAQEGGEDMATATKSRGRRKASPAGNGTRLRGQDLRSRNREILKALKGGQSLEAVARRYRLAPKTVGFIRWKATRRIPAKA